MEDRHIEMLQNVNIFKNSIHFVEISLVISKNSLYQNILNSVNCDKSLVIFNFAINYLEVTRNKFRGPV